VTQEYRNEGQEARGDPATRRAAERYLRAGLAVIPVPSGEKNPNRPGWQQERWTIADIPRCWTNGQNIGLLTGEPSAWLVDVDLDCHEAVKIAGRFLDPTLTSGRESTPDAHWWYRSEGIRSVSFEGLDGETILEIRSNGRQTVVAPSRHPSGERYLWSESGLEFGNMGAESLLRACRELATAALVARVLPSGGRHRFGLALAGFLLRRGLEPEAAEKIMHAAWDAAGFSSERAKREAHDDIAAIVEDTAEGLEAGTEISGGPTLDELRPGLPRKISRFWRWTGRGSDQPPPATERTEREEPSRFNLTDLGNAERLVTRHGEDLRYCHPWRKWLAWDGRRWAVDATGEVERRAIETVRSIYTEAGNEPDEAKRKALADHAKRSESRGRIEALMALARSRPGIPAMPEDLDADPWALNTTGGTIDLRTGDLRLHDRADLLTKIVPIRYDADAVAPIFERFLERILPSKAVRSFLQRAVGYAATGIVREEMLPILHGPGANGKSTLTGVLLEALGDYAIQAAPDLLMLKKGAHPTELADLFGARFVVCMENEEGRRLAESLVKHITGRDRLKARRMREDFWEFEPTHTVFLGTNHRPEVRGTDHAIWRRLKLIPFDVTIPEAEQDKTLPETLRSELPGILAWVVRGCIEYQRDGLGEPEQVRNATKGYRSDMDPLEAFIDECCVVRPAVRCKFADLYSAYTRWCEESHEHPVKKRRFADRLTERGFERDVGTDGVKIRRGIALRHDGDPDPTRITDPDPDSPGSDPHPPGSEPEGEENGNPAGGELPIGNSQNPCKSEGSHDRITDHYQESSITDKNLSRGASYAKVGNDPSLGNSGVNSTPGTRGGSETGASALRATLRDRGLTEDQERRHCKLVREGMKDSWALRTVLAEEHALECGCEVCA
jgi:P4 family phage/plasmid primase-like protien